ncbi:MAG TPA: hypothetical protein VFC19_18100 [Candidatus Limnocylindrales bacterium]|nr:hypothetical protein [Candidatus Limnocylindrales bacterium]
MFELVKALVEAVAKAIPAAEDPRRQKHLTEMGPSLFLLYLRIHETLVTCERIADILELYVRRAGESIAKGDDDGVLKVGRDAQRDLEYPLDQQRINLADVCSDIRQKRLHLRVFDGETSVKLDHLLWGKLNAVTALLRVLSQRSLPLSPTDQEIAEVTDPDLVIDWWEPSDDPVVAKTSAAVATRVVPTSLPWDREVYETLSAYLDQQRPRDQLARSWAALSRLRPAIEHVTVAEVLLALGKAERRTLYDGYQFGP